MSNEMTPEEKEGLSRLEEAAELDPKGVLETLRDAGREDGALPDEMREAVDETADLMERAEVHAAEMSEFLEKAEAAAELPDEERRQTAVRLRDDTRRKLAYQLLHGLDVEEATMCVAGGSEVTREAWESLSEKDRSAVEFKAIRRLEMSKRIEAPSRKAMLGLKKELEASGRGHLYHKLCKGLCFVRLAGLREKSTVILRLAYVVALSDLLSPAAEDEPPSVASGADFVRAFSEAA